MEIKKIKKEVEKFEIECDQCAKVITGISERQVKHNYNMHKIFCKKREEKK